MRKITENYQYSERCKHQFNKEKEQQSQTTFARFRTHVITTGQNKMDISE